MLGHASSRSSQGSGRSILAPQRLAVPRGRTAISLVRGRQKGAEALWEVGFFEVLTCLVRVESCLCVGGLKFLTKGEETSESRRK